MANTQQQPRLYALYFSFIEILYYEIPEFTNCQNEFFPGIFSIDKEREYAE
jgi:hypothetical protein